MIPARFRWEFYFIVSLKIYQQKTKSPKDKITKRQNHQKTKSPKDKITKRQNQQTQKLFRFNYVLFTFYCVRNFGKKIVLMIYCSFLI